MAYKGVGENGVRFEGKACADFLYLNLVGAMKQLQRELLLEAQQNMLTSEGRYSLHEDEIETVAGVIVASIVGGAWASMDEWGTGSLMDMSNPSLKGYMSGPLWNPARHDTKIRSRSDAPGQIDIFGRPTKGKGKGGFDLEEAGIVSPSPPSHAIQTAARWMANGRMKEKIQETVRNFPFGSFIVVDNK